MKLDMGKSSASFFFLLIVLFISVGDSSFTSVLGVVNDRYYMQATSSNEEPKVILQSGTAGTTTIYTNSTSAHSVVKAPATIYYPNDYALLSGAYSSGGVPSSVKTVDSDYLIVDRSVHRTYQIHPTSFYDVTWHWIDEENAWDWDNSTSATDTNNAVRDDIYWQTWNNTGSGTVTRVDLKVRLDLTGIVDDHVTVEWWVGSTQGSNPSSHIINSGNDGNDILISFDDCQEPNDDSWSWTDVGNIEIRLEGSKTGQADTVTYAIDEVWGWATQASYELDLEVQWTSTDYERDNEELCIYGGTMGSENITVDVWWSGGWHSLFSDLSSGWNNVTVTPYLTSETFTIRFKDGVDDSDDTQDSWEIDTALICIWDDEYVNEAELIGSSNTYNWLELNWTIDSSWTVDNVSVTLQLYNWTGGQYPTKGDGFISYSSGTADNDEKQSQLIITRASDFRNSTGGWRVKFKGVKSTTTQFDLKIDWIMFKPLHYSEYSSSTEFLFSNLISNTPLQLNFTVVSQYNVSDVNVVIQLWNYSSYTYVSSGEGYTAYISQEANETETLDINTRQSDLLSDGNARIKITGTLNTTTIYQQEFNQVKLAYKYNLYKFDHVLEVSNQVTDTWNVRLRAYSQTNIERLENCTIYLQDGETSTHIVILNGVYSQQEGAWQDLSSLNTFSVAIDVQATVVENSYIYAYLEVLVPNTSTYSQLVITFEIK